jgi:hypothetical protein
MNLDLPRDRRSMSEERAKLSRALLKSGIATTTGVLLGKAFKETHEEEAEVISGLPGS